MFFGWVRGIFLLWVMGTLVFFSGCGTDPGVPAQADYQTLTKLAADKQAVVRIYMAPIPILGAFISHTWFVIKPADSNVFTRWEVWLSAGEPYGYLRKNFYPLEGNPLEAGEISLLAEKIGPDAEPIVAFIENHSVEYPHRYFYLLVPGPNCNTYTQWVLDHIQWDVVLPDAALGKDFPH